MIYLMNYLEELIDIISEEDILEFYYTDELNTFDEAEFEIPADYQLDVWKNVKYFGFFHREDFKLCRVVESKLDDTRYVKGIDKAESDLRGLTIIEDRRPQNVTADQALTVALENTGYSVGTTEDLSEIASTNFYYISPREALVKIIETWNCEFRIRYTFVDNMIVGRYIDLYKRQGQPTGKQFVYGDDLLSVVHEESEDDIVTALIGLGKGEAKTDEDGNATGGYGRRINFADVVWSKANGDPVDKPAGQKVLFHEARKVPYGISQRNRGELKHRYGVFIDEEVEDPNVLIRRTWEELERASLPLSIFKANILSIGDGASVGDTVAIIKDALRIAYEARIQKIVFDMLDNGNSEVILGDYQTLKNASKTRARQEIQHAVEEAFRLTSFDFAWQEALTRIEEERKKRDAEIDEQIRLNQLEVDNALLQAEQNAKIYADGIKTRIDGELEVINRNITVNDTAHGKAISEALSKATSVEKALSGKASNTEFQSVKETTELYERLIGKTENDVSANLTQLVMTSGAIVSEVGKVVATSRNLVYAPSTLAKYMSSINSTSHLSKIGWSDHHGIRVNHTTSGWQGVMIPLTKRFVTSGDKLAYRVEVSVDTVPKGSLLMQLIDNTAARNTYFSRTLTIRNTGNQVFTGVISITKTGELHEYALRFNLTGNGNVVIHRPMVVEGETIPTKFTDSTDYNSEYLSTRVEQTANSWAVKSLNSNSDVLASLNVNADGSVKINDSLISIGDKTYIKEGIIGSAVMREAAAGHILAGSIDADILKSDTVTSRMIKVDRGLFNKLISDEVIAGSMTAKKLFATIVNAVDITAEAIKTGIMSSKNSEVRFNLNESALEMNSDVASIRRVRASWPIQFLKLQTGTYAGTQTAVTTLGSNAMANSENPNNSYYTGIRIWNSLTVRQIDLIGNTIRLANSGVNETKSWMINQSATEHSIVAVGNKHLSRIETGDIRLFSTNTTYQSLRELINLLIDNIQQLHNHKTSESYYVYTLPSKL